MTNQKITNIFSTKNNEDSSDLDDEDIFNWVAMTSLTKKSHFKMKNLNLLQVIILKKWKSKS